MARQCPDGSHAALLGMMRTLFLSLAVLVLSEQTLGDAPAPDGTKLSALDIAAAMDAAALHYGDLTIHYLCVNPDFPASSTRPSGTATYDVLYRCSPTDKRFYCDLRVVARDAKGLLLPHSSWYYEAVPDGVISFDGKATLVYRRPAGPGATPSADIYPGVPFDYVPMHQFDNILDAALHFTGPMSWGKLIQIPSSHFEVEGNEDVDGLKDIKLHGVNTDYGEFDLWVSLDRSFAAVKSEYKGNEGLERHWRKTLSDFTRLENGMWFPRKIFYEDLFRGYSSTYTVLSISSAKLGVQDFHPRLPPGTFVRDNVAHIAFVTGGEPATSPSTSEPSSEMDRHLDDFVDAANNQATIRNK